MIKAESSMENCSAVGIQASKLLIDSQHAIDFCMVVQHVVYSKFDSHFNHMIRGPLVFEVCWLSPNQFLLNIHAHALKFIGNFMYVCVCHSVCL